MPSIQLTMAHDKLATEAGASLRAKYSAQGGNWEERMVAWLNTLRKPARKMLFASVIFVIEPRKSRKMQKSFINMRSIFHQLCNISKANYLLIFINCAINSLLVCHMYQSCVEKTEHIIF